MNSDTYLNFREHVRKRLANYFGSADSHGVVSVVDELVTNGLDLFLQGTATRIGVSTGEEGIIYTDDGPGLPYDVPGPAGTSLAEHYLTVFHDAATADDHAPHLHLSGWGSGLAVVTAVSEFFEVATWRSAQFWLQEFRQGLAVGPPRIIERGAGKGTRIRFRLDGEVFSDRFPHRLRLRRKMFEAAHLIPGVVLQCEEEIFHAREGLAELVHLYFARDLPFGLAQPHFSC
jgi:DNA gyrase subunit B